MFAEKFFLCFCENFFTKIDLKCKICCFHRIFYFLSTFCVKFKKIIFNNNNAYLSKHYSIVCPIPQLVPITNVSAILVDLHKEIFAKMQKFSRNCGNKNVCFNPNDNCILILLHIRSFYLLFSHTACTMHVVSLSNFVTFFVFAKTFTKISRKFIS
jgi:hypothetical protein